MSKKGRQFLTTDGNTYIHESIHTYNYNDTLVAAYKKGTKQGVYILPSDIVKYLPNKKELLIGYLTFTIPSAIIARLVRRLTGTKGSPLENFLMEYYFKMEKKILKGKL